MGEEDDFTRSEDDISAAIGHAFAEVVAPVAAEAVDVVSLDEFLLPHEYLPVASSRRPRSCIHVVL